jgi:hypothetical protein
VSDTWPPEPEQNEATRNLALERASLFRACFDDTEAGKRVLEILDEYLMLDTPPGADAHRAGHDEGKRQLVRMIHRQIQFAKTGGQPNG